VRHLLSIALVASALTLVLSVEATGATAHSRGAEPLSAAAADKTSPTAKRHRKRALRRRRRHAQQTARRSIARRRHGSHRKATGRAPESPSASESTSASEPPSAGEPTSAPEPAPSPESEPEPSAARESESTPAPEPEPAPGPDPSGQTLFNGNFDAGFRGWYVQSLSSRASLVSSGVFQGSQAARFEVRQGDVEPDTGSQRSEVSGPTFDQGQDLYVRDAIRVPGGNTFSAPWQIVEQLHEEDWSGSPGMALFLENSHALRLGAGDGSPTFWQGPVLQSGRWYDLVYRVNLSQSASGGFVEVWLDGVQQRLANGQTRIYGQTIQAAQTYLKAGIYRSKSSTGTSIVEHDAIAVGTSYSAVTIG
jgi:Polysaccharide lyase